MDEQRKDKHRQSFYLPETMLDEIRIEAKRLNRSVSWVVQRAWKLAKRELGTLPKMGLYTKQAQRRARGETRQA